MIKTTILSLGAAMALVTVGQASVLTLSGGRTGPLVITAADGTPVSGGLVRVGTLSGAPASPSVDDIGAVFQEFATGQTAAGGRLGQTFINGAAAAFNNQQVFVWVFDTDDANTAAEHGIFTVVDPANPASVDRMVEQAMVP